MSHAVFGNHRTLHFFLYYTALRYRIHSLLLIPNKPDCVCYYLVRMSIQRAGTHMPVMANRQRSVSYTGTIQSEWALHVAWRKHVVR